jgi:flavin-binding protein dodecin
MVEERRPTWTRTAIREPKRLLWVRLVLRHRHSIHKGLKGGGMSEHVYKIIELVGSTKTSIEEAIQNALAKAATTIRDIRWFEVVETRGYVEHGKVAYYQVTLKLGFTLEE